MASKRNSLGKGIDSLIPARVHPTEEISGIEAGKDERETVRMIRISRIEPNREQPRKKFDEHTLEELAESIRQHGVIQPLIVQEKNGYYEIIAGERRWRAAKLAGLSELPAIVRDLSVQEAMEISLIENIQREDLNPIEEAAAYQRLIDEFNLKQEELAGKVSKSRTAITNSLRLLKLTKEVQAMVAEGVLSGGHARCLVVIENETKQIEIANKIAENHLSVRETEKLIKTIQANGGKKKPEKKTDSALEAVYEDIEKQLKEIFGTKVEIKKNNKNAGKIEISYYSQEELERILEFMRAECGTN